MKIFISTLACHQPPSINFKEQIVKLDNSDSRWREEQISMSTQKMNI